MRLARNIFSVIAVLLAPTSAYADTYEYTATALHENCSWYVKRHESGINQDSLQRAMMCMGFMLAIAEDDFGKAVCTPPNSTLDNDITIYETWISNHPEKLRNTANLEVREAMAKAFPCSGNKGQP